MAHRKSTPEDLPEKLRDFLLEEDSLDERDVTEEGVQGGSFVTGAGAKKSISRSRYRGGEELGEFRLLRLIGQGGMGEVWEAEQPSLGRRVALKLVLPGRVDERGLDLFAREARAGGRLSHPGIVSVYGAGSDGDTHWIAMELVADGCDLRDSLDDFKEQDPLPEGYFDEVTELLASIADALEHAHDAGVIHRDIKPRNILITPSNDPKLTDFGLARITDEDALTVTGEFAGTYYYMSPEQAAARRAGLDHRTDIFSLGVVMYELLSLQRPFEGDTTHQVAQKIMFEDPPDLLSLRSRIPKSLVVICGMALEKSRDRRYLTMGEFAADLRRHLAREPVLARPPGRVRKAGLWIQRNPTKSALLVTGTLALVAISALAVRVSDEKGRTEEMLVRAEAAEADALLEAGNALKAQEQEAAERMEAERAGAEAELARVEAAQRAKDLQQMVDFQAERLSSLDVPAMGWGIRQGLFDAVWEAGERAQMSAEELDQMGEDLRTLVAGADFTGLALSALDDHVFAGALEALDDFENQPLVQAQLMQTMADTLRALGLLEEATGPQQQTLEIRRRELGDEHPETLLSIANMGSLLTVRGKYIDADTHLREALDGQRRLLGDSHPQTLSTISNLGKLLHNQGILSLAEPLLREALDARRTTLGDEHPHTLKSISGVGKLLQAQGNLAEAGALLHEALEASRRVLGDTDRNTLILINDLGQLMQSQGNLVEAEALYIEALEGMHSTFGYQHPQTLIATNNLGTLLQIQGRLDEAEPFFVETWKTSSLVLGDRHPNTMILAYNLSGLLKIQGKLKEAEQFAREALDNGQRVLGEDHPNTLHFKSGLASILHEQGRFEEAETLMRDNLERRRRVLGDDHPNTLVSINNFGMMLKAQAQNLRAGGRSIEAQARSTQAERYLRQTLEARRRLLGEEHHQTLISLSNLGALHQEMGELTEAEALFRETLEARRRVLGDEHRDTLASFHNLGCVLAAQDQWDEAEPFLREALRGKRQVLGANHSSTLNTLGWLVRQSLQQGELAESESLVREALELAPEGSPELQALLEEVLGEKSAAANPSTEDERNTDGD